MEQIIIVEFGVTEKRLDEQLITGYIEHCPDSRYAYKKRGE